MSVISILLIVTLVVFCFLPVFYIVDCKILHKENKKFLKVHLFRWYSTWIGVGSLIIAFSILTLGLFLSIPLFEFLNEASITYNVTAPVTTTLEFTYLGLVAFCAFSISIYIGHIATKWDSVEALELDRKSLDWTIRNLKIIFRTRISERIKTKLIRNYDRREKYC